MLPVLRRNFSNYCRGNHQLLLACQQAAGRLSYQYQLDGEALVAGWRFCSSESTVIVEEATVEGAQVQFEVGRLARLADGSCVVKHGDTTVLATAVYNREAVPPGGSDFLPLQVDYQHKYSASGRIPATANKRESGINERDTLGARLVDRALRPLFPKGLCHEVQLVASVLSAGGDADPAAAAINATSAAILCSGIPWHGPVAAVKVGLVKNKLVVNPSRQQQEESLLDLTYAGTSSRATMIEAGAKQVPERTFVQALELAQAAVAQLIPAQLRLAQRSGAQPAALHIAEVPPGAKAALQQLARPLAERVFTAGLAGKSDRGGAIQQARGQLGALAEQQGLVEAHQLQAWHLDVVWDDVQSEVLAELALAKGRRLDGRALDELRRVVCSVGPLPRVVHGSALFERGDTQVLASATVGSERDVAELLTPHGPQRKHFMLHYNFPPFSVNETGKMGAPGRREIGHGALAEKALAAVLPDPSEVPFSIRLVADTLGSSGSSSMAATCGGWLALRHAQVPLSDTVAGISIGLVGYRKQQQQQQGEEEAQAAYALLTDIQGAEDHLGDMDFKVAGTRRGLTAVQLDMKVAGLPVAVLADALVPAREARKRLMALMEAAAAQQKEPPQDTAAFGTAEINKELLPRLIGPAGANIVHIEEATGARLVVHDSGEVALYAPTATAFNRARSMVLEVEGHSIQQGSKYLVKVAKLLDYGAVVEFHTGLTTLLHISQLSWERVRDVRDVLQEGQELEVLCIGRNKNGMVEVSRKELLPKPQQQEQQPVAAAAQQAAGSAEQQPQPGGRPPPRGGSPPARREPRLGRQPSHHPTPRRQHGSGAEREGGDGTASSSSSSSSQASPAEGRAAGSTDQS